MKQRRINATLTIAALALTTLLILTALPQAGATAPTVASLSTNPKRINESAAAHSFIRSPFVDSTSGTTTRVSAAPRLERQPLESLTALNSTETTESDAPLSAFSVPSAASVVQSPGTTTRISAAPRLERQPLESLTALNSTDLEAEAAATERGAPLSASSVPFFQWQNIWESSEFTGYAQSYSVIIHSVSPAPPYCVLRNSPDPYDRLLELRGENFSTTDHHLQFRRVDNGALSIHFHMEVNWESTTRITVDMADIKHLLWDDARMTLTVRITSNDYEPLSDWGPEFILADDVDTCGIAQPTPTTTPTRTPTPTVTPVPPPVRGIAGDLSADVIIGKPDFSEFTPYEVVPYKVFNPGGIIVDRSIDPGRAYIWDSGNSRILGIDLAKCYASASPCSADIVIGQPSSFDHSACNGDSGFQRYPQRAPASAATLCGIPEDTLSILENKSFVSMAVDQHGNLYVPDSFNHRVLKYISPFSTDTIADEVWGQSDFSGNMCNGALGILEGVRRAVFGQAHYSLDQYLDWKRAMEETSGVLMCDSPSSSLCALSDPPPPTASTLCFHNVFYHGSGVELDSEGNLWVADGGNNRVLRFPVNPVTGVIAKAADLVLGQTDFTIASPGSTLDKLNSPSALRFGPEGWLYVADSGNDRVLVFEPPFYSGMEAASTFGSQFRYPNGLEINPFGEGVWINDFDNKMIELWGWDGITVKKVLGKDTYQPDGTCGEWLCYGYPACGGGLGIDGQGNILPSVYGYTQDVLRFKAPIPTPQPGVVYQPDKRFFTPPLGYNYMGYKGLRSGRGVAVYADQLVVADAGRLLFWNDIDALANGKVADGVIGDVEFRTYFPSCCGSIKVDAAGRLWMAGYGFIDVYPLPLGVYSFPIHTIPAYHATLPVLGGGSLELGTHAEGIAPVGLGEFVWISDVENHRVLRIRNPLTDPVVDVILGQTDINGTECNRGLVPPPNTGTDQVATADMLCYPGALSLDRFGNLYVSDHAAEVLGNFRLLLFAADLFPTTITTAMFAPPATKIFPYRNAQPALTFEPAFDATNRMVVGYNPYLAGRFVGIYDDPLGSATNPNVYLNDFHSWPESATFDVNGNLYVGDGNRSRVLVYFNPFDNPTPTVTPTPLHTPTPTATPISRYPVTIQSVSPAPPDCALRNAPDIEDRLLEISGENLPATDHSLQFRKVGTGEHSIHFGMEVNWESSTRITVDMDRIKHLLWDNSRMTLQVRVTDASYEPVSNWSSGFVLADDVDACCVLVGNVDEDRDVDIRDVMLVASSWRCRCEDECYDPRYDLDGDCDIDIVDIMLVVVHWGDSCED